MKRLDRRVCMWALLVAGTCSTSTAGPVHTWQKDQPEPPRKTNQAFDVNELSSRQVRLTRDWLKNKISTQGTSAEVREIERERGDGGLRVDYHIFVKGAPKDQLYDLQVWSIKTMEPSLMMTGLSIAHDGLMICAGRGPGQCRGEKLDDDVAVSALSPAKGEPFRWVLASGDNKTKVFFAAVPDPIRAKDKGCALEVIRLTPKFELAMIRAWGYRPNEELQLNSKSYAEAHDWQAKSDADGEYVAALLPFVKDKQTGKTEITVKGGGCAPKLSFEWGR